jgi:hypothetical protein
VRLYSVPLETFDDLGDVDDTADLDMGMDEMAGPARDGAPEPLDEAA